MAYELLPLHEERYLFYRLGGEVAERHGAIGYLRADFGSSGNEFYSSWFDIQKHLKSQIFKDELDGIINFLRDDGDEPVFASRLNLQELCLEYPEVNRFRIRTQDYSYYFRFEPGPKNYDIYCFVYDNSYLFPELAGMHELPDECYSLRPSDSKIIILKRGESGCYVCEYTSLDVDYNRDYVDTSNKLDGITRAQEEAMLAGSIFGWAVPAAKPWNYDKEGKPRILKTEENIEPEEE